MYTLGLKLYSHKRYLFGDVFSSRRLMQTNVCYKIFTLYEKKPHYSIWKETTQGFKSSSCKKHFVRRLCYWRKLLRWLFLSLFNSWRRCFVWVYHYSENFSTVTLNCSLKRVLKLVFCKKSILKSGRFKPGPFLNGKYEGGIKECNVFSPC